MSSMDFLNELVAERLAGDARRLAELFENRDVFDRLVELGRDGDWYHFSRKTYDGWYLVESQGGFDAYYQERGAISDRASFTKLCTAADYFFRIAGYARA
jgi:hypothetical protein